MTATDPRTGAASGEPALLARLALPLAVTAVAAVVLSVVAVLALPEKTSELWLRLVAPERLTLRFGVLPDKPMGLSIARALQQEIGDHSGFSVAVIETADLDDHLRRLDSGDLDFVLLQGALGLDPEAYRAVIRLGHELLHIVVPDDSALNEIGDIAGRRIVTELPGDASRIAIDTFVEEFEFDPPVELIDSPTAAFAETLQSGQAEVAVLLDFYLDGSHSSALLRRGGYRLIALPQAAYVARQVDGMQPAVLPMGAYGVNRSLPATDLPTLAVNLYVVTRPDQGWAQVRAVLRALFSVGLLQHLDFDVERLSEAHSRQTVDYALHPAAVAYFDRNEPVSSDQFEIAAFFLGLLLAIWGATQVLYNRWRRQLVAGRRARIGAMMQQLFELDTRLRKAEPAAVGAILDEMMALENEAEAMWLRGEIGTEDVENFFERSGSKIRNAQMRMLEVRLGGLRAADGTRLRPAGD